MSERQSLPTAPMPSALVLADQANAMQRHMPWLTIGNVFTALATGWLLKDTARPGFLAAWLALQVLLSAGGLVMAMRLRGRPAVPRNAVRRLRASTRGITLSGLAWGAGLVALWPTGQPTQQFVLALLAMGSIAGAMNALSAWLPACYGFFLPTLGGLVLACVRDGAEAWQVFAMACAMGGVVNAIFAHHMHNNLLEALMARREIADLADRLAGEKRRAEEASQAKSRFLAAASHDLRQPVHALSLFVGALRARPEGPQASHLIGRIDATVSAMAGMFNALLDMSRLDAGMVHVAAQDFDLQPLVRQLVAESEAVAVTRGLRVDCDLPSLRVHTDPLLLERILRNLLANAVRYTDEGGVRVHARRRGGRVLLRVADSGAGIARDQIGRVFEEFYQGHNPERDRNKGLGLGLAIVRRLCELLGLGLGLRSRSGRGTVVSLRLSPSRDERRMAPVVAPTQAHGPAAAASSSSGGELVLVIDDDDDIRAGMRSLLECWGCAVVDAPDLATLRERLAADYRMPRLAICDYRLREGRTGLEVAHALQDDYNEPLPCILVTGDTAPERLLETSRAGVQLLHKPVDADALHGAVRAALAGADEPRA